MCGAIVFQWCCWHIDIFITHCSVIKVEPHSSTIVVCSSHSRFHPCDHCCRMLFAGGCCTISWDSISSSIDVQMVTSSWWIDMGVHFWDFVSKRNWPRLLTWLRTFTSLSVNCVRKFFAIGALTLFHHVLSMVKTCMAFNSKILSLGMLEYNPSKWVHWPHYR